MGGKGYKWNDEQRQRHREKMSVVNARPEKRLCSAKASKRFLESGVREHHSEMMREINKRPEVKKCHSEGLKRAWSRPEERERRIESLRKSYNRPGRKETQSKKAKEKWSDLEVRKRHSESAKKWCMEHGGSSVKGLKLSVEQMKRREEMWNRPEMKEAARDRAKKYWESCSDEVRRVRASHMRRFFNNPSRGQIALFERIRFFYSTSELEYIVADRKLDIAIPEYKINIEYDGVYWHQNPEKDKVRDELLQKLGWTILRVREGKAFDINVLHKLVEEKRQVA